MTFKKEKTQKFISSILVVLILMPSFMFLSLPKKAEASGLPVVDIVGSALQGIGHGIMTASKFALKQLDSIEWKKLGKQVLEEAKRAVVRKLLAEMTRNTVDWINRGFYGNPLFIENPGSFFKDVGETQIKEMVGIIGYDPIRFPFGKGYLLNTIENYKRQLSDNVEYSMSKVTNDPAQLAQYRRNFNIGGWEGFILTTQYPQNNVIGFEMSVADELLSKYEGAENKLKTAIDQGQGFLSPQVCKSDPSKSQLNPYKKPSFDSSSVPYDTSKQDYYYFLQGGGDPTATQSMIDQAYDDWQTYDAVYSSTVNLNRYAFDLQYTCPEGLSTSTPGAVVASKAMKALNMPEDMAWLNQAIGGSLATIFDALLKQFIGKGLTSLSKSISNNTQPDDEFSYYGTTLGGAGSSDDSWSGLPDEEVDVNIFKKELNGKTVVVDPDTNVVVQEDIGDTCSKTTPPGYCATPGIATYIPGAIANTALELRLISNPNTNNQNPGIIEVLDRTWPVAKDLDMCIPGPNKGWEERLDEDRDRIINSRFIREAASDSTLKVKAANGVMRDLKFAVSSFKDWLKTKMISSLPSAILFIDAINEIDTNDQEYKSLAEEKQKKATALARLQAIESALSSITTQPAKNTPEEKNLIRIRKQFLAVESAISNPGSLEDKQGQLELAKDKLINLMTLKSQCLQERTAAGWTTPAINGLGVLPSAVGLVYKTPRYSSSANNIVVDTKISRGNEVDVFCEVPAVSGYSHGEIIRPDESNKQGALKYTFRNPINEFGNLGYEDLPMVKAGAVYGDDTKSFDPVNIDLDCGYLFKTNDQDYKHAGDERF